VVAAKLPSFNWSSPTRVIFGTGELSRLETLIEQLAGSRARVFLVTGRRSLREQGVLQNVVDQIGNTRLTHFDQVTPFPSPQLVDTAVDACRVSSPAVVVAIGGGSAIDVAKLVAILATHQGSARGYLSRQREIHRPGIPLIAVPTTSGSSSEVTSGAAVWDWEAKRSLGLGHPLMFPAAAIVDPELAMSMPGTLAGVTGMDAFTSAFESYWSLEAEPFSDALNLEVIRLYAANLEASCTRGDPESRGWCALAATMSGIAYSNSHPNVCHAIGSPLTLFWGVDHGQAVAITLPALLRWTAPAISAKLPALWEAMGVGNLDQATERLIQIMQISGLKTRLHDLGVGDRDMETLLEHVRWDRLGALPRALEKDDLRGLIQDLL